MARLKTKLRGRLPNLYESHGGRGGHAPRSESSQVSIEGNDHENTNRDTEKHGFQKRRPTMKPGEKFLPDDFTLTDKTLAWLAEKHPTVDIDDTLERFCDHAAAKSWAYRDWQAAFRNYVRNGKQYGGVTYKQGRNDDPLWTAVLQDARKFGFREPHAMETPSSYRTQLMLWRSQPTTTHSNVLSLKDALKSVR